MIELLTNKHSFTIVIICLYILQTLFQILYHHDYTFGWYWFAASQITVASMIMSNRSLE